MSTLYPTFSAAIERTAQAMRDYSRPIHTDRWQGLDISNRPEALMREVLNWDFRVLLGNHTLAEYQEEIKPNLPWADEHFEERVCGYPMNPGNSWETWPWAVSAGKFRDEMGRFEINYMERFWASGKFDDTPSPGTQTSRLSGIRGRPYGDLGSVVDLLAKEPLTRQAYLPIFFPEDTGAGGRVPCSLGYHWIMRNGYLHVYYPIRSCDFYRHFRDDVYLAVRLTLWLLDELRGRDPMWHKVVPGQYTMWIGSLHMFINDYTKLFGQPVRG